MALRGSRRRAVVLEDVLRAKLREINSFNYKGRTYPFSDAAIEGGIDSVVSVRDEGLVPTNHTSSTTCSRWARAPNRAPRAIR